MPNTPTEKPSLFKQALGAVIGGSLGLLVYSGYTYMAPHLTAWTTIPQRWMTNTSDVPVQLAEKGRSAEEQRHFAARAQEIADKFGASYKKYHVEDASSSVPAIRVQEASSISSLSSASMVTNSSEAPPIAEPSWIDGGTDEPHAASNEGMYGSVASPGPQMPNLPNSGVGGILGIVGALSGAVGWSLQRKKRAA